MNPPRIPGLRALALACLCLVSSWLVSSCATHQAAEQPAAKKELVTAYGANPTVNYPARLLAIVWPDRRADAGTSARFGSWQVRFGKRSHIAFYYPRAFYRNRLLVNVIVIGGDDDPAKLRCTNSAVGNTACSFTMDLDHHACRLVTLDSLPGVPRRSELDVPCPSALEVER